MEVQKTAGIVNRARKSEKAEYKAIQSTDAGNGLIHLGVVTHTVECYTGHQKLATKTLLATLTQILPLQVHVTQAYFSVTSRNLDITHTILI